MIEIQIFCLSVRLFLTLLLFLITLNFKIMQIQQFQHERNVLKILKSIYF